MDETEQLILQAQRGDPQAREALLANHLESLQAFIRLRTGAGLRRKETSLDLMQSVCREVLQDLDRFEYRGDSSFRHWLFRRAENKIQSRVRFWRRDKRNPGREEGVPEDGEAKLWAQMQAFASPSRQLSAREGIERVERAFAELPEDYREVICLARIVGLPHEQVAAEMQRTPAATRTLLSRALARLATQLEDGS